MATVDIRRVGYNPDVPSLFRANSVQLFVSNYRSFRRSDPSQPALSSSHLDAFRSTFREFVSQTRLDLEDVFRKSDLNLYPFTDPLRGDLLMPFVLANDREETYSAVLEWLIRRLPEHEVAEVFGLDDGNPDRSQPWTTAREYPIRYGNQLGRLDLVLGRNGKFHAVIEIKTRPYTQEDLLKHALYCAAIAEMPDMCGSQKIFLAQRVEDMNLGGVPLQVMAAGVPEAAEEFSISD